MEVRKLQYVDIHYDKHEQKKADEYGKYLISLGYVLEHQDTGGITDFCYQYWKPMRFLKLKDKTDAKRGK